MAQQILPQNHRALVLTSTSTPPTVQTIPTPHPGPGSVVIRILAASVLSYARNIYNGARRHPFPTPLVPGCNAIGRVAAVGPDATLLTVGTLVHVDCTVRGRDDATAVFLSGIHEGYSDGSRVLMRGEWKDSTYAEYAKVPLETCDVLDEARLCGKWGYEMADLAFMATFLVPYGGLRDVELKAGETVVVSPATGTFGGAAVVLALAMGAKVIAMGRNVEALQRIKKRSERIETVPVSGDVLKDSAALKSFGPVDVFFDISPPEAGKSTHIKSGILALKHSGRVSLMGGIREDVPIPHSVVIHSNLTLKGKWMYEREDIKSMIKMVENGVLKLGESAGLRIVGKFGLEDWDEAFTAAENSAGIGEAAIITPLTSF